MDLWTSKLQEFSRPEFYLMDRDNPPPQKPKYYEFAENIEARADCTAWTTKRKELENYIHPDVIRCSYPQYAGTGADFEDVPELLAQAVHEASESAEPWDEIKNNPEKLRRKVSAAKRRLNDEFASQMTGDLLSKVDTDDEVITWLKQIYAALD